MCTRLATAANRGISRVSPARRSQEADGRAGGLFPNHPAPTPDTNMDAAKYRYTQSHEWASVEGAIATVGISDFAVRTLTDLVYLELPKIGRSLKVGDTFGVVESVKAASDLFSPVAGEVVEVNTPLASDLAVLSEDPQGRGWLMKVKLSDPASVASLMDQAAYDKHCASEAH